MKRKNNPGIWSIGSAKSIFKSHSKSVQHTQEAARKCVKYEDEFPGLFYSHLTVSFLFILFRRVVKRQFLHSFHNQLSRAKQRSLLASSLPHQYGIVTILPAPKNRKMSSMLKLKPASKAAARM